MAETPKIAHQDSISQAGSQAGPKSTARAKTPPVRIATTREPDPKDVPGHVSKFVVRQRHWGLLVSFVAVVLVPLLLSAWYLFVVAADQYSSKLAFTVRSEDTSNAASLLNITSIIGGSGSHNTDIVYEFIRSQEMASIIDARLGLREIYSRHEGSDPLLSFDPDGTIEDLTAFWQRMVRISYDAGTGLMDLTVLAFTAEDARDIALAIQDESSRMINDLSASAREDATRYARDDLELARASLRRAREDLTKFRIENQIVDVNADIQGQVGLLNTLQEQLASALIEYDLLTNISREGDPRLTQGQRRIDVIRRRIDDERLKFGTSNVEGREQSYANIVADFERLTVEREFAEGAYTAAKLAYDASLAEANRQRLYLAAYIRPTVAERSEFPRRGLITTVVALFAFLVWAILCLVFYSLRESSSTR